MQKAIAWADVLKDVPAQHLRASYQRAIANHTGQYAPTAYEILQGWTEVGEELAELARRTQPATGRALPAPMRYVGQYPPTNIPALLVATANALGVPVSMLEVQGATLALRKADPAATVAEWQTRIAAVRAADSAPTLASLVAALTAPVESEAP